ncbi:MAG: DUF3048 domain-containing protein [Anaerolineales bacterium]
MSRFPLARLGVLILVLFTACGNPPPALSPAPLPTLSLPTATALPLPSATPTVTPSPHPPSPTPDPALNPLTGLPAPHPELLRHRPVAIKITNFPRYVRPQSGLSRADVVFEYYIEAALTRFIAVFYGDEAERVGPVRSGRYFDAHVARMFQSFFVFKFADPRVMDYLLHSDLAPYLLVIEQGECPPFALGKNTFDNYNNVFFDLVKFRQVCTARMPAEDRPPDFRPLAFDPTPPRGAAGVRISIRYSDDSYHFWSYDPQSGRYQRYQETADTRQGKPEAYAPLTDALDGRPILADNVVVLFVRHTFANRFDKDDEVFQIELEGFGPAVLFRDGIAQEGFWHRDETYQPLRLTDAYGDPLPLRPGVTFYQVLGLSSRYWSAADGWHFIFQFP